MEHKNGPSKGSTGSPGPRVKEDDRKLFVGGLPKNCEERDLKAVFEKYGTIESVQIKKDPITRTPRGFGFIVFSEPSAVEQVLAEGEVTINDKKVEPRKAARLTIPGKIFVGGLTHDFSEDKLREFFSNYGTVTDIQWPFDRQKNQKRAYCFLTFENRDTVTELLKNPRVEVCGRELEIKKVKYNPDGMWQGGGFGGYGTRGQGAFIPAYGAYAYASYDYKYPDYAAYDDYYKGYEAYYYPYEYEGYPAGYGHRAPRGGRTAGGYTRHAPY